jgi:hypothetical protein
MLPKIVSGSVKFWKNLVMNLWLGDSNTKLLQVALLQKHFQNSNGDKNSDLVKFNSSKCVHISSLKFFGSRVVYMF